MIADFYTNYIYNPLFELLIFIYQNASFDSLGLAIIILTIVIRVVLLPLFYKSAKSQALMKKLKPKIDEIRDKYKEDKEKQAQKLMSLYKKYSFNPFSGFLVLIVQLPIFFALFRIFRNTELITETFSNTLFLGVNLIETSIVLTFAVAILQYFQGKMTAGKTSKSKGDSPLANFGSTFQYIAPAISFIVLIYLPSALALYWGMSTLFSLGQQHIINKKIDVEDVDIDEIKSDDNKDNDKEE